MRPREVATVNSLPNFIHRIKGIRYGRLGYMVKHQLSEFQVSSGLKSTEKHKLQVNKLGTNKNTIKMDSGWNKQGNLDISNKLRVRNDRIQITIDLIHVVHPNNLVHLVIKELT